MIQRIADLAEYSKSHDIRPIPVKTEYDKLDILYPEPVTIARRLREYMLNQNVLIANGQRFTGQITFDGSVPSLLFPRLGYKAFAEVCSAFYCKPYDNLVTFEWQHTVAEFGRVIAEGVDGFISRIAASCKAHADDQNALDYLDALEIICDAIVKWGEKCAAHCEELAAAEPDEARRRDLCAMATICRSVPAHPAKSFREGIQALYICFNFQPDSFGTIDRYLYPLYRHDLSCGVLTREEAKEFLQEFFLMVNGWTPYNAGGNRSNYGGESHFAIGGLTEDGEDGYNELTALVLEALMELPTYRPQISFRWTHRTPFSVLKHVLDCERHDVNKRIALINDEPRVKSLMQNAHVPFSDAVNYSTCGCNEPCLQGGIWFGGLEGNIVRCLTNTLYNRENEACACKTFDEFYALFSEELAKDLDEMLRLSDAFNVARAKDTDVLSSLFMHGCIEEAKPATQGGCTLAITGPEPQGIVCLTDSLTVIQQFVYDEKMITMKRLIDVLRSDWHDEEPLRQRILKTAKFFGNDEEISNAMARRITQSLFDMTHERRGIFDTPILFGTQAGYNPHYVWFGNLTDATPDGRHRGDPFMVGMGQTAGKDREGLTALLNSVAQADPNGVLAGPYVCNVNVDPALIRNEDQFDKTARMIEAYFRLGGMHIQLNYVSPEDLKRAKVTPDKYKSLRVRVSGYSANFVLLTEEIQDDIIRRTLVQ